MNKIPTKLPSILDLDGCQLDLLHDDEGRWLGIGGVRVNGFALRDGTLPLLPEIRTTEAVELCDWRIVGHAPLPGGGLIIELEPHRRDGGVMEWMLHRVHNRYRVTDWTTGPQVCHGTRLWIELRAAQRLWNGDQGVGFSYRFHYNSVDLPIHRILDRGSWEPGGSALDCEFWLRCGTSPSHVRFMELADHYSTEWWLAGCHNPSIFQFMPFQTQFPGFTLTSSPAGALVTWVEGVAHVRSLFEKQRGSTRLMHLHEHCDDLAHDFTTKPVEVLWFAGERDHTAIANLWEGARSYIHAHLHAEAGIREERVGIYGVVEEWGMPDFARYTREAVPALLEIGVTQVMIPSQFMNNMNTRGTSNMCCTLDYHIAEAVGAAPVKAFCDALRQGGAVVHHWGNTAISTYSYLDAHPTAPAPKDTGDDSAGARSIAEVMQRTKQAFVRNMAGHIEVDHYSPVFCQLNLRDPQVTAYWHERWKAARSELGFGGIFLDSSFNLSSDKFHWIGQVDGSGGATIDQIDRLGAVRPTHEPSKAILSQYKAHLDLVANMQGYGYQYSGEDIGVFGVRRSGPALTARLDNLFMWRDCLVVWDPRALRAAGADPRLVFFSALAYRCMCMLFWHIPTGQLSWLPDGPRDEEDRPSAEQRAWLLAFKAADSDMHASNYLPNGAGVLYTGARRRILWAFTEVELATTHAIDLTTGMAVAVHDGRVRAPAMSIYALTSLA